MKPKTNAERQKKYRQKKKLEELLLQSIIKNRIEPRAREMKLLKKIGDIMNAPLKPKGKK